MLVVLRLYRLMLREAPDLVHNFTLKSVAYGSLAARLAGVKNTVNSIVGLGWVFTSIELRARLLRPLVTLLLRIALADSRTRVIVQHADDRRALVRRGIVEQRLIRTIPGSGIDANRFHPRSTMRDGEPTVVCMATRLLRQKGISEYVAAARMLRARNLPIRFLLAGAPDPENPATVDEVQLDAWRKEAVVELVGHVHDMPVLLRQCDILVLPTSYGEGIPRILLEGGATGLPLVASDTSGCRDVVSDGVNGLLVAPGDVAELADAIAKLHNDPVLRATMGAVGRRRILRDFEEQIIIGRTLGVYAELLPITHA
jgi:glycosyltransferase involved in cell wall biosynthesis